MLKIDQRDYTFREICNKLAVKYERPVEEIYKIVEYRFSKLRSLINAEDTVLTISFPYLFKIQFNKKWYDKMYQLKLEKIRKGIEEKTFYGDFDKNIIDRELAITEESNQEKDD